MSRAFLSGAASSFWQLFLFRWREFVRTPEIVFWVLVFPCATLLVLGIAFRPRPPEPVPVLLAAAEGDPAGDALAAALGSASDLRLLRRPPEAAERALLRGEAALVVVPGDPPALVGDPTNPETRTARLLVRGALSPPPPSRARDEDRVTPGTRYVDWLMPGLLGLQIMNGSLWGLGFALVEMRAKKLLKRFAVTPMSRVEFLLAHAAHRFLIVGLESAVLFGFAALAFGVPLRGSLPLFGLTAVVGTLAFSGIGILVASRPRTTEVAAGVMNVPMLPQMVLSGVFFSAARFPDWLQPLVQALPLTALNDALRGVALEGAGLAEVGHELSILTAWGVLTLALGLRWFRWT